MMSQKSCSRCQKSYVLAEGERGYAPFCSKRCADIDLGHWLNGDYVIGEGGGLEINQDSETLALVSEINRVDEA